MAAFAFLSKTSYGSSRTVWPRITKFYTDIHTGSLYGHTGYDVTSYFRSEVIPKKKTVKNAASDSFVSNFFKMV